MSQVTTHKPTRSTPYVAPGAPTSPLWGRAVGLLLAAVAWVAGHFGMEMEFSAEDVMLVAGLAFAGWSAWQDRRARAEQAPGVDLLEAALDEPPSTERLLLADSVERLRQRRQGLQRLDPPEPVVEPVEPALVEPRVHLPSGALLDDDGEPVSAGDLDSRDDPDPDERSTERVTRADVEPSP